MKKYKVSYGFIAPFMIIFVLFTVAPVIIAMFFSLTNFNVLQPARFVGLENYKNLFIKDPLFLIALKNTILFAAITGPLSYLLCLWLAWFINDLRPRARAVLTLLFYAPTLANVYMVWQLIFSGDANGFLNAWLIKIGALVEPIGWLTNKQYMVPILMFIILWGSLGTTFLTFIAGFQTVNVSLYEAAAVDGIRNRWQELWYVTLPVMRRCHEHHQLLWYRRRHHGAVRLSEHGLCGAYDHASFGGLRDNPVSNGLRLRHCHGLVCDDGRRQPACPKIDRKGR